MTSQLKEKLGPCATGECAINLLLGKIQLLEEVYETTMEVLKYLTLKQGTKLNYKPKTILPQKCQSWWSKTKERTSSAMRECKHFRHWEAKHLDENIAKVHTTLANIPYLSGYSSTMWQNGVNTLIPKETGSYRVDRSRAILLYEAAFNFNNKIPEMRMMH